jgi:hypothetical protein
MVRGSGMYKGRKLVLLGLSAKNLELLKEGRPMHIDLRDEGVDAAVYICYGETEQDIVAELQTEGGVYVKDDEGTPTPIGQA